MRYTITDNVRHFEFDSWDPVILVNVLNDGLAELVEALFKVRAMKRYFQDECVVDLQSRVSYQKEKESLASIYKSIILAFNYLTSQSGVQFDIAPSIAKVTDLEIATAYFYKDVEFITRQAGRELIS